MFTLAQTSEVIIIVAISVSAFIAVVSIIFANLRRVLIARTTEQTRRELAAYVAEGTITPDEAERLLKAGPHHARQGGA